MADYSRKLENIIKTDHYPLSYFESPNHKIYLIYDHSIKLILCDFNVKIIFRKYFDTVLNVRNTINIKFFKTNFHSKIIIFQDKRRGTE